MPFTALIPSAGRSSRMGSAKAWLEIDGESLLQRIARTAVEAGAHAVVVVAGAEDEVEGEPTLVTRIDVATRVTLPGEARLSVAVAAPDGQLIDSIRAGYDLVGEGSDLLLWPVDAPFADAATVERLADALGSRRDAVAVPMVGDSRGHPVLFGEKVAAELATPEADPGAHAVVRKDPSRVITVPCDDRRLTAALNTPADAAALGLRVP